MLVEWITYLFYLLGHDLAFNLIFNLDSGVSLELLCPSSDIRLFLDEE